MKIKIELRERTAETVKIYFEKANKPNIKALLPQKATTLQEALDDYEKTKEKGAISLGKTIWVDGTYVGDIWCYCINKTEEPNSMLSYCIFEEEYWSKGIATMAVKEIGEEICRIFKIQTIGAFTYAENAASIRVLEKSKFKLIEEFVEDGRKSVYYQWENIEKQ